MERNCESVPVSVRPGKCLTEYRLPQPLRPLDVGLDLSLGFAGDGEQAVDFGDDAVLFGEGGKWHGHLFDFSASDALLTGRGLD